MVILEGDVLLLLAEENEPLGDAIVVELVKPVTERTFVAFMVVDGLCPPVGGWAVGEAPRSKG